MSGPDAYRNVRRQALVDVKRRSGERIVRTDQLHSERIKIWVTDCLGEPEHFGSVI